MSLIEAPGQRGPRWKSQPQVDRSWMRDAACAGQGHLFFPDDSSPPRAALALCLSCPVQTPCGEFALTTRQDHGIWGGMSERARRRELRRRNKGTRGGLGTAGALVVGGG